MVEIINSLFLGEIPYQDTSFVSPYLGGGRGLWIISWFDSFEKVRIIYMCVNCGVKRRKDKSWNWSLLSMINW